MLLFHQAWHQKTYIKLQSFYDRRKEFLHSFKVQKNFTHSDNHILKLNEESPRSKSSRFASRRREKGQEYFFLEISILKHLQLNMESNIKESTITNQR